MNTLSIGDRVVALACMAGWGAFVFLFARWLDRAQTPPRHHRESHALLDELERRERRER